MSIQDLSEQQKQIFRVLMDQSLWRPPTYRTIMKKTGIKWTQQVAHQLQAIKKKGYIDDNNHPVITEPMVK